MKNQFLLVMFAMLVTVFVLVPMSYLTIVINIGCLVLVGTTLIQMMALALNCHTVNYAKVPVAVESNNGSIEQGN